MAKKYIDKKEALSKAQALCARGEKCKSDISKKLYDWGISSDESEEILNSLVDDKFIDESRYTGYYVNDKFKFNKWGKRKIQFHLKQKQIPESLIYNALDEINDEKYISTIEAEMTKKLKTIKAENICNSC
jgi:regulatory protein